MIDNLEDEGMSWEIQSDTFFSNKSYEKIQCFVSCKLMLWTLNPIAKIYYRTRSNYSNILIIRTVYIIILFLSNSLNMLHLEILTRSIRPNDHTPVQ